MTLKQGLLKPLYKQQPGMPSWDSFRQAYGDPEQKHGVEPSAVVAKAFCEFTETSITMFTWNAQGQTISLTAEYAPSAAGSGIRLRVARIHDHQWTVLYDSRPFPFNPIKPDINQLLAPLLQRVSKDEQRRRGVYNRLKPKPETKLRQQPGTQSKQSSPPSSSPTNISNNSTQAMDLLNDNRDSSSSVQNPDGSTNSGQVKGAVSGAKRFRSNVWHLLDNGTLEKVDRSGTKQIVVGSMALLDHRKKINQTGQAVIAGAFEGKQFHQANITGRQKAWRVVIGVFSPAGKLLERFDVPPAYVANSQTKWTGPSVADQLPGILAAQRNEYKCPKKPQKWKSESAEAEETDSENSEHEDEDEPEPKRRKLAKGIAAKKKEKKNSKPATKGERNQPIQEDDRKAELIAVETESKMSDNKVNLTRGGKDDKEPIRSRPSPVDVQSPGLSPQALAILQRLDPGAKENNNNNNGAVLTQALSINSSNNNMDLSQSNDESAGVVKAFLVSNLVKGAVQAIMHR